MIATEDPLKVARALARDHVAESVSYAEDRVCRLIATVAEAIARRDQRASLNGRLEQYAAVEQALPTEEARERLREYDRVRDDDLLVHEEAGYVLGFELGRMLAGGR